MWHNQVFTCVKILKGKDIVLVVGKYLRASNWHSVGEIKTR